MNLRRLSAGWAGAQSTTSPIPAKQVQGNSRYSFALCLSQHSEKAAPNIINSPVDLTHLPNSTQLQQSPSQSHASACSRCALCAQMPSEQSIDTGVQDQLLFLLPPKENLSLCHTSTRYWVQRCMSYRDKGWKETSQAYLLHAATFHCNLYEPCIALYSRLYTG